MLHVLLHVSISPTSQLLVTNMLFALLHVCICSPIFGMLYKDAQHDMHFLQRQAHFGQRLADTPQSIDHIQLTDKPCPPSKLDDCHSTVPLMFEATPCQSAQPDSFAAGT